MFSNWEPMGEDRQAAVAGWEALGSQVMASAARIAAATCSMLGALAAFDAAAGWDRADYRSPADWMCWHLGMDRRCAREHLVVARRLGSLALIRECFSRGELSFSQVAALVSVATPQTQARLVELARGCTGSQLAGVMASYRRALAAQVLAEANDAHARRQARWWFDEDGMFCMAARLGAEEGKVIQAALEAAVASLKETAVAGPEAGAGPVANGSLAPERVPGVVAQDWGARRADALVAIAESSLAAGLGARPGADRRQVVLHVSADALSGSGSGVDEGEHCEIEQGPAVPVESARRIACDAALVTLVEDAQGNPLSLGRKTRAISPALRRALVARDNGCTFPGCAEQRFVEAHHITHWAAGGETSLNNLSTLCWFHHRLVHEGGYRVQRQDAGVVFIRPNGAVVPTTRVVPGPFDGTLEVEVDPGATFTRWDGSRADHNEIINIYAQWDSRLFNKPRAKPPDPEPEPPPGEVPPREPPRA